MMEKRPTWYVMCKVADERDGGYIEYEGLTRSDEMPEGKGSQNEDRSSGS